MANEEWWTANEPRLATLETEVADQATRLELAEGEKLGCQMRWLI